MIKEVKKTLNFLETKEKNKLLALSITKFFTGLMDLVGVASIIPFLAVISNQEVLDTNKHLVFFKDFLNLDNNSIVVFLAFASFILLFLNYLTRWFDVWYDAYVSHNIWLNLSKKLFNQYLIEPYSFYIKNSTNYLLEKIQIKINFIVIGIIHPFFQICGKFFSSILLFSILLYFEPLITFLITIILIFFYSFIYLFLKDKIESYGKLQAKASTKSFKTVDQAFKSIKDIKLNNSYNFYINNFFNISETLANVSVKKIFFIVSPKLLIELMSYLFAFSIIIYLMLMNYHSLSDIILLIGIYTITLHRILPNIQIIFQEIGNFKYYKPSYDEIFSDLIKINLKKKYFKKKLINIKFHKEISFENIDFKYDQNKNKVLTIKNLKISAGEYLGITGPSGSGKSTLINLITGLLNPNNGKILVDKRELVGELIGDWQSAISYVPQLPFIADDTIMNNIAYGLNEDKINFQKVKEAAKIAQISEFIENKLPLKYETIVGEDGIRLSGGQRQRLSIARAIYTNKDVLIMDESTSSLDVITEKQIIDSLIKSKLNKTIIFVTHRVNSLRNCDNILILNDGKIDAYGKYNDLENNSKTFKNFLNQNNT